MHHGTLEASPPSVSPVTGPEDPSLASDSSSSDLEVVKSEDGNGNSNTFSGLIDDGPPSKNAKSCSSPGHHRQSALDPAWHKQHQWLLYNNQEKTMYCQLCMKYGKLPKNGSGKWVQVGVVFLQHDKIRRHECSMMLYNAQRCKNEKNEACLTGGIHGVLEAGLTRESKAVIGALKCLYFYS